jgi:CRP/FNR family transcriptional regulator
VSPSVDEILRATPGFRKLTAEDRQRVAAVTRVRTFTKGETIFREQEPSDSFYSIASGRVKIVKASPSGKDLILEVFGVGDPFGAVAVYEGRPFPASAIAMEDTTCILIQRREFFALLEQYPSMVRGLLLGLTQRLIELTNRLTELTGGRIEARFARLFLKLGQDIGQKRDGGVFVPLPLSRQELADMTGTTIETAIRIMSRWTREEVVRTEKDGFTLLDLETLRAVAAS